MSLRSSVAARFAPLLAALAVLVLLAAAPARAQDDPDPTRFEGEIAAFEASDRKDARPPAPILFVGSSSIRMWPTAERFPGLPVVNRGFGGAHISDVLHYFDRVVQPYAPRTVVFYGGDNDVAGGKSADRVLADYLDFVNRVHAANPDVDVIFLPIKPSLARWEMWPEMRRANALVEAHAKSDPRLHYVDTVAPMLGPDGTPRPELLLDDGLHMTPEGYDIWTARVRAFLQGLELRDEK